MLKRFMSAISIVLVILLSITTAFAHSGRTDGSGGHKDNKNKSGLGSYHYHCGGYPAHLHNGGYCPYTDVFPSSVRMSVEKTTLGIGEKVSISAAVYPSNACNTSIDWDCSDTSVISLSNGVITAKSFGTATITAESFNGKKATVRITVKEITANKVTVSGLPQESKLYIGDSFTLSATISPANVDNPSIVWSSSNEEIATVSQEGLVELREKGKVKIMATASNGVVGKVDIDVQEKYVETVDIADAELDMLLQGEHQLTASVAPSDATHPELTWTAQDPTIVSVSEQGLVTALACGETVVSATATSGVSDSVFVKVTEIVAESLEIEGETTTFVGDEVPLTAIFAPVNTTVKDIVWSTNNEEVAVVSADGTVKAVGEGSVTITATQKDVSATYVMEIYPVAVEKITIIPSAEGIASKGDIITFTAEVFPENATYADVTWSVSNPEIASIEADGTLTALKGGVVTVIATADDGFVAKYTLVISSALAIGVGGVGLAGVGAGIVTAIVKKKKK